MRTGDYMNTEKTVGFALTAIGVCFTLTAVRIAGATAPDYRKLFGILTAVGVAYTGAAMFYLFTR